MSIRLTFLFAALLILASVHIVALELYLYWRFLWLDIPMHVLGGICVALGWSVLPLFRIRLGAFAHSALGYLGAVLCIGVLWELFEYWADISLAGESNFWLDTGLDLLFDLVGGYIGYQVAHRTEDLSHL